MRCMSFLVVLALAVSTAYGRYAYRQQNNKGLGGSGLNSEATTFQAVYGYPGAANCTAHWFTQYIDHFSFGQPSGAAEGEMTYQQKYLTFDKYYKPGGPIFFYAGNEAPITIFADIAGLMWQHAEEFNAALVFAEHRFFGESQPCNGSLKCFPHLSTMQAMADYAILLTNLTTAGKYMDSKGIICFGGSYGGMLSGYMRMKYPNLITGSIASSGPVTMVSRSYDRESWWKATTYDATAAGGAAPECARNIYDALQAAMEMVETKKGREDLSRYWQTCDRIPDDAHYARYLTAMFAQSAFGAMAMGNYPMPLNFIFGTVDKPAPAYPMRKACEFIKHKRSDNYSKIMDLYNAMAVINNVSETVTCNPFDIDYTESGNWDYMVCSEEVPDSQPYFASKGWPEDMFYKQTPWTKEMMDGHCKKRWGVTTRWGWMNTSFGAANVGGATNIVWANGLLDPWHTGGILNNVSDTVRAYIIQEGAHHLDLLFSTPGEPKEAAFVRSQEMRHVREWLDALKSSNPRAKHEDGKKWGEDFATSKVAAMRQLHVDSQH